MTVEAEKRKKRKQLYLRIINIVIVIGFGIFLVYYLLSQVEISDIKDAFLGMYIPTLVAALAIMLLSNLFRACIFID